MKVTQLDAYQCSAFGQLGKKAKLLTGQKQGLPRNLGHMPFVERCSNEIPFLCYLFSTWWSSVLLVRHHQLLKLRVGVHIPCGERMVLTELLGSFFFLLFAKGLTFKVSEQVLLHLTLWKLIYNALMDWLPPLPFSPCAFNAPCHGIGKLCVLC